MLKSLCISNFILIENQEIEFYDGFTVITGETGAGKSILINALNLILGSRPKGNILYNPSKKAVFEAIFENINIEKSFFEKYDIDYDKTIIIRREILPSGKSRLFINDTPVNISVVKELSTKIIDIHSQHQNLLIQSSDFQASIIDSTANNQSLLNEYKILYKRYKLLNNELNELQEKQEKSQTEKDFLQYRLKLLKDAQINENEIENLEQKVKELSNFEEIKIILSSIVHKFYNSENAILQEINNAIHDLEKTQDFLSEAQEWSNRMQSLEIELSDILNEISNKNENLIFDEEEYNTILERYNLLNELLRKFNASTTEELLNEQNSLETKLSEITSYESKIAELEKEINKIEKQLFDLAKQIHTSRIKVKPNVEKNIEMIIKNLGIKNGRIIIEIKSSNKLHHNGMDEINIKFSANKQSKIEPINQVASGGELSRIMLAIKSLIASHKNIPTIIFDEIDTGVSGEIATKMAEIMKKISTKTQIIAITHLPQIAAKGKNHLVVEKIDKNNKTITIVKNVSGDQRIKEIAKMLSGNKITSASIENAKLLMN